MGVGIIRDLADAQVVVQERDDLAEVHAEVMPQQNPFLFIAQIAVTLSALMLSAGIVGLPNVGKSTLFNAVTRTRKAQAANYPFAPSIPNVGIVTVPDPRLQALSKLSHSQKTDPGGGRVRGHRRTGARRERRRGLGNQFLSHIREVDAIVQVVRCFEDADIHHVSGTVDPVRDIEVINTELILADLASAQKRQERNTKSARSGDKVAQAENALLARLIPHLDAGKPALLLDVTDEERKLLRGFFLLSGKPTIFACNVAESDLAALTTAVAETELHSSSSPAAHMSRRCAIRQGASRHAGRGHQRADRERTGGPVRRGSRRISPGHRRRPGRQRRRGVDPGRVPYCSGCGPT